MITYITDRIAIKITLLISIVVTVTMAGVSFFIIRKTELIVNDRINELIEHEIIEIHETVSEVTNAIRENLKIIAEHPEISMAIFTDSNRGIKTILNKLVSIRIPCSYLMIVDGEGDIFAVGAEDKNSSDLNGKKLIGMNIKENPLYSKPSFTETVSGNIDMDPFLSIIEKENKISRWFITPVLQYGKDIFGWVVFSFDFQRAYEDLFNKISSRFKKTGKTVTLFLMDSEESVILSNGVQSERFIKSDDKSYKKTLLQLDDLSFYIVLAYDKSDLSKPVKEIEHVISISFCFVSLLLITLLYAAMNKLILKRLKILHEGVRELDKGNFKFSAPVKGSDELDALSGTFNKLTVTLSVMVKELIREKNFSAGIIANMADSLIVVNPDATIRAVNQATLNLLGLPEKELVAKNLTAFFEKEDSLLSKSGIADIIKRGTVVSNIEKVFISKESGRIPVLLSVSVMYDEADNPEGIVCVAQDISLRKKAEETIRESEEKFRAITESANDAIILLDNDGNISNWNMAAVDMFGYTAYEAVGRELHALLAPKRFQEPFRKGFDRFKDSGEGPAIGKTLELAAVRKNGIEIPVELSVSALRLKEKWNAIGIIRDISERKKYEIGLQLERDKLLGILNNMVDGIYITTGQYEIKFVNVAFEEEFGPVEGRKCYEHIHNRKEPCEDCIIDHASVGQFKYRQLYLSKTGRFYDLFDTLFNDLNNTVSKLTMFHDITKQKKTEEALLDSEEELSIRNELGSVFLTIPDDDMYSEALKIILKALKSKYGVFGYISERGDLVVPTMTREIWDECRVLDKTIVFPQEEWGDSIWVRAIHEKKTLYSNTLSDHIPEGHIPITRNIAMPIVSHGHVIGLIHVANKETDYRDKDIKILNRIGEYISPVLNARLERDRQDRKRELFERELQQTNDELKTALNELNKTQKMLIRSEKLSSLGQLSAGVAHEIKNPLNIISTSIQLLMMEENMDDETMAACRTVMEQVNRSVKIIDNLRDFARKKTPEVRNLELNHLLKRTMLLVEYEMRTENIDIVLNLKEDCLNIQGDEDQLAQVFLNIINNARDSLNEKQRLISTEALNGMNWSGRLSIDTWRDDKGVNVRFRDNGTGISEEHATKIFDPFFTTKEEGKGTGLGLSIAYGIIQNHNGVIVVDIPDEGMSFTICFPPGI